MENLLNTVTYGENHATEPPLVIAHGLFGSAKNWVGIAKRLCPARKIIVVDMRNHGESPRADTHDYPGMAADLAAVLDRMPGPVDLLGHSMGGKAAMALAVVTPGNLRRLIVADIAPVAYTHTQAHLVKAMAALNLPDLERRSDADRALSVHVEDRAVRAFLLQSLKFGTPTPKWLLNLPVLAAEMDKIIGFPALDGQWNGPTLFLSGAASDYVTAEHRPQISALFPKATFASIPGAGHWLHAEAPEAFCREVEAFLE